MATGKFVSYLRVSTAKQGDSGLGLEAQQAAVAAYTRDGVIVKEFREVESGKRNDRPALAAAMKLAKKEKAVLVIAKLDRLARNVAFIANLMESGVEFVAVDMPKATEFTVHIMAAVAEQEAKAISVRTKAALQAAKAKGRKLGGRRVDATGWAAISAIGSAAITKDAEKFRREVRPVIAEIQAKGITTLKGIAEELNAREIETRRGGEWSAVQVVRVLGKVAA